MGSTCVLCSRKAQIQFSRTLSPSRAPTFCRTGRQVGRQETVLSRDEEVILEPWSQLSVQPRQ